ncbi:uncharacterized protein [Miscanthus floridulus]|uniref:uncharacterized protein n=1 Tax=Miscanthus floridulus TaxID=154761 RepID=UPI00345B3BDA
MRLYLVYVQAATAQIATTRVVALSYVHKVSLASDFMYNQMTQDLTASFGYDYMLRQCPLRGKLDTNGVVSALLEERLTPAVTFQLSAEGNFTNTGSNCPCKHSGTKWRRQEVGEETLLFSIVLNVPVLDDPHYASPLPLRQWRRWLNLAADPRCLTPPPVVPRRRRRVTPSLPLSWSTETQPPDFMGVGNEEANTRVR